MRSHNLDFNFVLCPSSTSLRRKLLFSRITSRRESGRRLLSIFLRRSSTLWKILKLNSNLKDVLFYQSWSYLRCILRLMPFRQAIPPPSFLRRVSVAMPVPPAICQGSPSEGEGLWWTSDVACLQPQKKIVFVPSLTSDNHLSRNTTMYHPLKHYFVFTCPGYSQLTGWLIWT